MAYVCSRIAITWFDGVYPSESGARVLLAADDKIDEGSPLSGAAEQIVQRVDYIRGAGPDFFPRGGKTTALEWDRVRPMDRHDVAAIAGLEAAENLPTAAGWVLIQFPDYGRAWVAGPAAVRRTDWRYDLRNRQMLQRWSIDAAAATEIALTSPEHAWLWEDGSPVLWEDGTYMALETLP